MITEIETRIAQLEAEREQLRAQLQAQLDRDIAELKARAELQLRGHDGAIGELKRLVAQITAKPQAEGAADA